MMTMWNPIIERNSQHLYLALADAIERDIASGQLKPGDRLPTHRDLARSLDVTIGTITRAYREAQRRGLTTGEVGRGSFVREQTATAARLSWDVGPGTGQVVLMSQNFPVPLPAIEQRIIGPIMRDLSGDVPAIISAIWPDLLARHQRVGARWLQRYGIDAQPQNVLISTGFQPALWAIVSALCNPGDAMLADQLTTPGLLTLAGALKVRVAGVSGDEHGMLPAALERAIAEHQPRALYLTPTIQTPTAAVMPEARRREIAAIIAKHDVLLIEDDDNLPLLDHACDAEGTVSRSRHAPCVPTLTGLVPDRSILISDVGRSLGLGVRLSYVLTPASRLSEISAMLLSTTWMPAPIVAELAARLIDGSGAESLIAARREELRERNAMTRRVLPPDRIEQHAAGHHAWLRLPDVWRSESFAAEALRRGVSVNAASTFAVNRAMSPGAVRICIGAPSRREELDRGLHVIAALASQSPYVDELVV